MTKPTTRGAAPTSVEQWMEAELSEPKFRQAVEETLNQMRIEQDLAELRERRAMSQAQVAKALGITQPAVARLESGRAKNIELRTLVRYAAVLGARVRVVIEEDTHTRRNGRSPHKGAVVMPLRKRKTA